MRAWQGGVGRAAGGGSDDLAVRGRGGIAVVLGVRRLVFPVQGRMNAKEGESAVGRIRRAGGDGWTVNVSVGWEMPHVMPRMHDRHRFDLLISNKISMVRTM